MNFDFATAGRLMFGPGRAAQVPEENEGLFADFPVGVDVQVYLLKD